MALLINGISDLELAEIGELIYKSKLYNEKQDIDGKQVEIWLGFINQTFVLSDFRLDNYFISSKQIKFIHSLFSKLNSKIEVLGFFDNDTDLPAGFSLYKDAKLDKRLIRNSDFYLVEDFGDKAKNEIEVIRKHIPNYNIQYGSVKEYLEKHPKLTDVYSENSPTWYIDEIVNEYLSKFTGKDSCYYDFYYGIKMVRFYRDKEIKLESEQFLELRGSYVFTPRTKDVELIKPVITNCSINSEGTKLFISYRPQLSDIYKIEPAEKSSSSYTLSYKHIQDQILIRVQNFSEVNSKNQQFWIDSYFAINNFEGISIEKVLNQYADLISNNIIPSNFLSSKLKFLERIDAIEIDASLNVDSYIERLKTNGLENEVLLKEIDI